MKLMPLVLALSLGLSGCDAATELGEKLHKQSRDEVGPMTYVFVPGFKVTVEGVTFPIYGTEQCQVALTAKVFVFGGGYDYPGKGTYACVVIEPETEKVNVRRVRGDALVNEVWRVEREGNEVFRLRTADGKPVVDARSQAAANAHNCATTGPNSPIVTGKNSTVVINGKTYAPGQSADCAPASTNITTHGVGSPIVTGAGSKVIIHVEQ